VSNYIEEAWREWTIRHLTTLPRALTKRERAILAAMLHGLAPRPPWWRRAWRWLTARRWWR
jgi:hypothetical protein